MIGDVRARLSAWLQPARLTMIAVVAGGAVGALARVALIEAWPPGDGGWPWATFVANLAGAALLAWITTRLAEVAAPTRHLRALLGTGLCGALTTFSALQVESLSLLREGQVAIAVTYPLSSIALGLGLAAGLTALARRRRYG